LDYVGRYTHRVAIANQRLLDMDEGHVRFRYQDYRAADTHTPKTLTLAAPEFIRRLLLHVLPSGFHRIRYYGWLGPRHRAETLARCRHLLGATVATPIPERPSPVDYRDRYESLTGVSLRRCPVCTEGHMIVTLSWVRGRPCPALPDTS
jgi:Putative transposase